MNLELLGENSWRGPGSARKPPFYKRTWFRALVALSILSGGAVFGVLVFVIQPLREKAATYDLSECKKLEAKSVIYDRFGGEIGGIWVMNRTPVSLSEVPSHLRKALIAQEDKANPLSDQAIIEHFASKGLKMARRTINKYRLELNISPSHKRKNTIG